MLIRERIPHGPSRPGRGYPWAGAGLGLAGEGTEQVALKHQPVGGARSLRRSYSDPD